MTRCYSLSTIEGLIQNAKTSNYAIVQVENGVLGLGHLLLIAPRSGFYNFEIVEEPSSCWGSVHRLRRFTKISKRVSALVAAHSQEVK